MPEQTQQHAPQYMLELSAQQASMIANSELVSMDRQALVYRGLGMLLLLSLSACSSSTLYERTDIHYIQACGGKLVSCTQLQAEFTQRCTQEHRGQVVLLDDLRPNRLHLVCRPAPEEKPSTGTPAPKADAPNMQQALQQSSPQGQQQAVSPEAPDSPDTSSSEN